MTDTVTFTEVGYVEWAESVALQCSGCKRVFCWDQNAPWPEYCPRCGKRVKDSRDGSAQANPGTRD